MILPDDRQAHNISTHALREEGDHEPRARGLYGGRISTHALREEGDCINEYKGSEVYRFLPTPSARRATDGCARLGYDHGYFYPRPPRGGRPNAGAMDDVDDAFLPTPSARRATAALPAPTQSDAGFLPTPSARRATWLRPPRI